MKFSASFYFAIKYQIRNEVKYMSFTQSIFTALFCMVVVFTVLVVLWAILRIFSAIIQFIEKQRNHTVSANKSKD